VVQGPLSPVDAHVSERAASQRALTWWLRATFVFLTVAASWLGMRYPSRALLLVVFVPLSFAPFCYARARVFDRCVAVLRARSWGTMICGLLLIGGFVADAIMLAQLLTARAPTSLPMLHAPGVTWVGPVWFSGHVLWLLGHLLSAGASAIRNRIRRVLRRISAPPATGLPASMERRVALQQLTAFSVGAPFALSLSGVSMSYDFRVDEHEIVLPHWPRALDGLRVAHLSDIHVGGSMNRERLMRVAELTSGARPDLVIHTGDFLTHRSGDFDLPLYEALARIEPDLGQWACLGNHDYDDPERITRLLREAGVRTLRGELATLALAGGELEIGGLDFISARRHGPEIYARIMQGWRPRDGNPRLLLNHDPSGFALLPSDCADLVCSGHTHGGHIGVQLANGAVTVVGMVGIPDQGIFERGDMHMFVTRCVGFYGYPIRLGIPPEIALLTIRSPSPSGGHT
jgi:predicted MPP superfamily phosphohydrolase